MVRVLAVALLVAVSAISGIRAPSFRRSFQLANLGNVYVMDWDVGALVEDTDKLTNFVEGDFDFFEYEQGRSSTIVVAGRLKSHIQFWRYIGASQFILDVIEHDYRIPFHSTPPLVF